MTYLREKREKSFSLWAISLPNYGLSIQSLFNILLGDFVEQKSHILKKFLSSIIYGQVSNQKVSYIEK